MDNDDHNIDNYVNVTSGIIYIKQHKMRKAWEKQGILRQAKLDQEFVNLLVCGVGKRLLQPIHATPYKNPQVINDRFCNNSYGLKLYTIRKSKVSVWLEENYNIPKSYDEIELFQNINGHHVKTMVNEYAVYIQSK